MGKATEGEYKQLLEKKKKAEERIASAKTRLDHPHGQWQSAHDLAESELGVWTDYLRGVEEELKKLEKQKDGKGLTKENRQSSVN